MKILFITPYNPANPTFGATLRIFHLLNQLCKIHDVTVAGFSAPGGEALLVEQIPALEGKVHFLTHKTSVAREKWDQIISLFSKRSRMGQTVRTSPLQQHIDTILAKEDFDFIQCEFPHTASFRYNSNAIKIMDAHNVEYDNFRRMAKVKKNPFRRFYYRHESEKMKRDEIAISKIQDAIFTTSERDKKMFQKDVPGVPKFVIPNGVDLDYFRALKQETEPEKHSLVFVGMMSYVPNYDGILYFLDDIFPHIQSVIPDIKIYIVGKNPPLFIKKRANDNVIVTGFVDDVRPFVHKSSVYVVPLRMGGGTRLKIVEALAMEKPIVTTSIGCEGIEVEDKKNVLIADQPRVFAESVIQLIRDRELANRLTENGYELAHRQYGWDSIGIKLGEAYKTLGGMYPEQEISSEKNRDDQYVIDELQL